MNEEKCFCHLNGFQVKDATARAALEAVKTDIETVKEGVENAANIANIAKTDAETAKTDATTAKAAADIAKATANLALPKTGGSMSGNVDMGGHKLSGLDEPENDSDAATKAYVDARISGNTGGDTGNTGGDTGNTGGVSSWNDLTDKPFYEEPGTVTLFAEQEITGFEFNQIYQLPLKSFVPAPFLFVTGETYKVKWKGTTWTCTAVDGSAQIPGTVGIGNAVAFGMPDTGEPFAIVTATTINELVIFPLDGSESVNVGIFQDGMIVKPLDAKFLPMEAIDARIDAIITEALGGDY